MTAELKYDVFISYSAQDAEAARILADRLRQQGIGVFIDRDLAPGTSWAEALREALQESSAVVVLFGPTGLGPAQSEEVLGRAAAARARIIPVLLPGADPSKLPPSLSALRWVDFRAGLGDEEAFQDLLHGIGGTTPSQTSSPSPNPLPTPTPPSTGSPLPELSIRPASAGDQPVDKDTLGFGPYVEAVAEFLINEDTHPPLTLSIEGEWGSGKSSFMLQLEKALQERSQRFIPWLRSLPERLSSAWGGGRVGRWTRLRRELKAPCSLTVRFNAWRHDKEDALWAAFASEFLRRIARQRFFLRRWYGHLKLFLARYRWRNGGWEMLRAAAVWGLLIAFGIAVPLAVYSAGWTWNLLAWFEKLGKAEDLIKGLAALGGAGAYVAGFISLALKAKEVVGNPLEINLRKYLQSPDYDGHVAFVESFHEDFRRIVDAYAGDRKVYVFVDDLDRCEVPKAADLMQALNLLITDDPRLIFIIGMDREKVAAGLAVKYEKLLPYLMPDGRNEKGEVDPRLGLDYGFTFIEKFVQLPFRVPTPKPINLRWFLYTLSGQPLGAVPPSPQLGSPTSARDSAGGGGTQPSPEPAAARSGAAAEQRIERRERLKLVLRVDSEAVEEVALMVAPALENNPRRLKQFVNLFRLRAHIASETGAFDEVEGRTLTFPQLGKFVAISLAWPGLLTDLAEKPSLLPDLQEAALGDESQAEIWVEQPEGRWFRLPALKALLKYGCVEDSGFPGTPDPNTYSLADADLDRLLRVSPKVVRTAPPPPPPSASAEPEPVESEPETEEPATKEEVEVRPKSRKAATKKATTKSAAPKSTAATKTVATQDRKTAKSAAPRQRAPRSAPHVPKPPEDYETPS